MSNAVVIPPKRLNVLQRLALALSPRRFHSYAMQVAARYEAGQTYSTRRSWLPGWVQDARFDADAATRLEILRKARYFERNNAIVNRLADLFEQYTVGPHGLRFVPASSDQEWNKRAKDKWDRWCETCDLTSRQSFGTVTSLAARTWMVDGEVFILKTRGREREPVVRGAPVRSYPRIQLIESHRVADPPEVRPEKNLIDGVEGKLIDGIETDERGRPTKYWVLDDDSNYVPYETFQIRHLFEPSRIGMYRGLSMLYPVMNDLHDLDDLQLLEMDAAKDHARITNVIKTKTGELTMDQLRRERFSVTGSKGTSGGSSQKRTQYYHEVFKGKEIVLEPNDEITQLASTRPSVACREYWDYLTSKICAGVGISKLLVFPYSTQGTVVRADLDVAAAFFRSRSAVISATFLDIYHYVMEWMTRNEPDLVDPPWDWKRVSVRPPASVNVDVGRNSNAIVQEYSAGFRTLQDICAERGDDWRDALTQRAEERAFARQLEDQYGLERGELIQAALEAVQKNGASQQEPQPTEGVAA